MKTLLINSILICMIITHAFAQTANSAETLNGTWLVQDGSAKVKIEKSNGKFIGKIVWLNPPTDKNGKPLLDKKNPDKSLQNRPQLGLPLLNDFIYDGDNLWTDGTIYDPESGKTYSCKITMKDKQAIEVRGYVGISLFGRTETWKRCENVSLK